MLSQMSERLGGLKQQLVAEKKKIAILGGLFAVLVVICIKQFSGSASPTEAVAVTPPPVAPSAPTVSVSEPRPVVAKAPESPTASAATADVKKVEVMGMSRDLGRDLFNTNSWNSFRPAISLVQSTRRATSGPAEASLWKDALAAIAASQREQQKEATELEKELAALTLQSTMTGDMPMAYISGRLLREGQAIDGFSVVHISDRRVLVRKGSFTRQLVMP